MIHLNVRCSVCKEAFESSDAIWSTSCGHVFHSSCMNKWKNGYGNCPQCRSYNPTMYSIYLNFDDSREYEKVVNDLNAKLESSKNEVKQLQDENTRLYIDFKQMRAEIENHSKEMHLQKTLNETDKVKRIQYLSEKINELNTTNSKLQQSLTESETLNKVLIKKIKLLEQRFKQEFDENVNPTAQQQAARTRADNSRHRNKNNEKRNNGEAQSQESNTKTYSHPQECKTQTNDCGILIKDFPSESLVYPLVDTVILLASKMVIYITTDDILDVKIVDSNNMLFMPDKIVLQVEFNVIDVKTKFLTCRNRLKFAPLTRDIQIEEHINDLAYSLFMYANRNLRGQGGYEYVSCEDNKVYAKKKTSDTKEILIENKDDVDKLLGSTTAGGGVSPRSLTSDSIFDLWLSDYSNYFV